MSELAILHFISLEVMSDPHGCEVCAREPAILFESVHSNGFNSPSMVGINSVTVG